MNIVRTFLAFLDDLFNKHQLVRRLSISAAWFSLLYGLYMVFHVDLSQWQADVAKVILGFSGAVVLYYHYRKP